MACAKIKTEITWRDIDNATKSVAKQIITFNKEKKFNYIVAVARGGFVFAQCLAYALEDQIKYTRVIGLSELSRRYKAENTNPLKSPKILVCDDIIDSGETFEAIKEKYSNLDITFASICIRNHPDSRKRNKFLTDFCTFSHIVFPHDVWITFPWDKYKGDKNEGK